MFCTFLGFYVRLYDVGTFLVFCVRLYFVCMFLVFCVRFYEDICTFIWILYVSKNFVLFAHLAVGRYDPLDVSLHPGQHCNLTRSAVVQSNAGFLCPYYWLLHLFKLPEIHEKICILEAKFKTLVFVYCGPMIGYSTCGVNEKCKWKYRL